MEDNTFIAKLNNIIESGGGLYVHPLIIICNDDDNKEYLKSQIDDELIMDIAKLKDKIILFAQTISQFNGYTITNECTSYTQNFTKKCTTYTQNFTKNKSYTITYDKNLINEIIKFITNHTIETDKKKIIKYLKYLHILDFNL